MEESKTPIGPTNSCYEKCNKQEARRKTAAANKIQSLQARIRQKEAAKNNTKRKRNSGSLNNMKETFSEGGRRRRRKKRKSKRKSKRRTKRKSKKRRKTKRKTKRKRRRRKR